MEITGNLDVLQKGDKGEQVLYLQSLLVQKGLLSKNEIDGDFGNKTLKAVASAQAKAKLDPDGIVGTQTWNYLLGKEVQNPKPFPLYKSSFLPNNQYYKSIEKKSFVTVHHTVSDGNPISVVKYWASNAERVATPFVIGNKMLNGSTEFDGVILCCYDPKYYAHHLGMQHWKNLALNKASVAIELCSFGPLVLDNKGNYLNTYGNVVPKDQVTILKKPFRGYSFWHSYSDEQLLSLYNLLMDIKKHFGFDESKRKFVDLDWFDLSWDAIYNTPWLTTHTNFRDDKTDCYPDPRLIAVLNKVQGYE